MLDPGRKYGQHFGSQQCASQSGHIERRTSREEIGSRYLIGSRVLCSGGTLIACDCLAHFHLGVLSIFATWTK